jgi:hypothetical protein
MAALHGETDPARAPRGTASEGKNLRSGSQKERRESHFFAVLEMALRHLEKPLKTPISSVLYELRLCAMRAPFFVAQIEPDQRLSASLDRDILEGLT